MGAIEIEIPHCYDSAVSAIAGLLASQGIAWPLARVAATTGSAFRNIFSDRRVPAFEVADPLRVLEPTAERLKARMRTASSADAAAESIDEALAAGRTALVWSPPGLSGLCNIVGRAGPLLLAEGAAGGSRACTRFRLDPYFSTGRCALVADVIVENPPGEIEPRSLHAWATLEWPAAKASERAAARIRSLERELAAGEPADADKWSNFLQSVAGARSHAASALTDAAERALDGLGDGDAASGLARAAVEFDAAAQLLSGVVRELFETQGAVRREDRRAAAAGMLQLSARRLEAAEAALSTIYR